MKYIIGFLVIIIIAEGLLLINKSSKLKKLEDKLNRSKSKRNSLMEKNDYLRHRIDDLEAKIKDRDDALLHHKICYEIPVKKDTIIHILNTSGFSRESEFVKSIDLNEQTLDLLTKWVKISDVKILRASISYHSIITKKDYWPDDYDYHHLRHLAHVFMNPDDKDTFEHFGGDEENIINLRLRNSLPEYEKDLRNHFKGWLFQVISPESTYHVSFDSKRDPSRLYDEMVDILKKYDGSGGGGGTTRITGRDEPPRKKPVTDLQLS